MVRQTGKRAVVMPLPKGTLTLKDYGPGSCVTGSVVRPAVLDMVIGSGEGVPRRHRIRSAVRQLSFTSGGEDADAMMASRDAACVQRDADATQGAAPASGPRGRPRLDSVQAAGFSPHSQRLWKFDRATELELVEELILQLVLQFVLPHISEWRSNPITAPA